MMRVRPLLVLCLAPFAIAAYVGCGDDAELGDCPTSSDAKQEEGKGILASSCVTCHSKDKTGSARNGAPGNINLDDLSYVQGNAGEIYGEVSDGSMPPGAALPSARSKPSACTSPAAPNSLRRALKERFAPP